MCTLCVGREDTRSTLGYLHNLVKVHDRHLRKVIETMLEVEKLEVVWAGTLLDDIAVYY